jgi:predicted RNA binding protein YcfA (HicA-like mRNA interferase family)
MSRAPPRVTGLEPVNVWIPVGFRALPGKGSHHFLRYEDGRTTVGPVHLGGTIGPGLLHKFLGIVNLPRMNWRNCCRRGASHNALGSANVRPASNAIRETAASRQRVPGSWHSVSRPGWRMRVCSRLLRAYMRPRRGRPQGAMSLRSPRCRNSAILLFRRSVATSFTPQFLLILKDLTQARLWTAATIKEETNQVSNRSLKSA